MMSRGRFFLGLCLLAAGTLFMPFPGAQARDAAFADPGSTSMGNAVAEDAVVVEPKGDISTGESVVNIARRATVYFTNKTNSAVEVLNVTTNDDGNVKSNIVSDDCSSEHRIGPGSRCSVVIETVPSNAGGWTTEVLLTHKGAGRIARVKVTGKASGQFSTEKRDTGFALSTKEIKPIDFSKVEVNTAKVVRTALMINDSPETITLLSIDVIAAENGLERLDQGCVIDMELAPGESCPVTLVWKPSAKGLISTDLIIRHSGRLGFAVIPIRGEAADPTGTATAAKDTKAQGKDNGNSGGGKTPTAAEEIEKAAANKIPPLTSDLFPLPATSAAVTAVVPSGQFRLIGTVGNRAVLLKPDGTTTVVGLDETIAYGEGKVAKITNISAKSAEIFMEGKKKQLILSAASELTNRAAADSSTRDASRKDAPKGAPLSSSNSMGKP
jgi:hypothetical protein